jgi:hypothetical protein
MGDVAAAATGNQNLRAQLLGTVEQGDSGPLAAT